MLRPNISRIRFIVTFIAISGVIIVNFRSKYEFRNPLQDSKNGLISESTQTQLESVVGKTQETHRRLEKYRKHCVAIREAYRKQQIDFPKAYSRYTGKLTASIERAIRGEDPEQIPELEDKLGAHQQKIAAHELRLNNLQPAIEDMLHRLDGQISKIDQLTRKMHGLEEAASDSGIDVSKRTHQEHELLLTDVEQLLSLIQDDLPRWGREIKDHQSFLRELSRFIQSIPE